jgi:hypothetical protein
VFKEAELRELGDALHGFQGNLEVLKLVGESIFTHLSLSPLQVPGFQQLTHTIRSSTRLLEECKDFLDQANISRIIWVVGSTREDVIDLQRRMGSVNTQVSQYSVVRLKFRMKC